jgi:hypothetical protein
MKEQYLSWLTSPLVPLRLDQRFPPESIVNPTLRRDVFREKGDPAWQGHGSDHKGVFEGHSRLGQPVDTASANLSVAVTSSRQHAPVIR